MKFNIHVLDKNYSSFKEESLTSRIFRYNNLVHHLNFCQTISTINSLGHSIEGREIFKIKIGTNGKKKVLIWSQMHGNESTGSLSMFDILRFLSKENPLSSLIKDNLDISFIPMLNPDGAEIFERRNAINIDLNRDASVMQCPETKILFQEISSFSPDILFNLHDQRSLFHVGTTPKPSVLSFLAPAEDYYRTNTQCRKITMGFIFCIVNFMNKILPGMIGRYSDEFNPTATGDCLQKMGYPCVLLETGYHYQDREKQKARKYTTLALLSGLYLLTQKNNFSSFYKQYFSIPKNGSKLLDILYENVQLEKNGLFFQGDIGCRIEEIYNRHIHSLSFQENIVEIGDLSHFFTRKKIVSQGWKYLGKNGKTYPEIGELGSFPLI